MTVVETISRKVDGVPAPRVVLGALRGRERPFLLESALGDGRFGRFSFAGCDPVLTWTPEDGDADPLAALREIVGERRAEPGPSPVPLPAGAVGFLSYDLARRFERLPATARDEIGLPDAAFGFYDAVLAWDHATGETWLSCLGGAERSAGRLLDLARGAAPAPPGLPLLLAPLKSTFGRDDYVAAVARARDYIAAGDVFQVNLSQRFVTETEESGADVYQRLVRGNPGPFAAYLVSPCGAEIVSASPERFFRVSGRDVEACPIKGTRPRSPDRAEDRRLAAELLESGKDRAELVMIVDLVRNDLGRVAEFGSVRVPELFGLTSHATVHHLHATVTARLAGGRDVFDLLRASFPCGSITGAPKVRAMEIIEETEPVRRGVYTGAIGYVSVTGEADLNVAIRTMTVKDGRASFSVGGGIVADSDPVAEYEETLDKGRGLAAALGFRL
jgi:para-aminobenzoate synthetase component 1